jgi:hypothetical protein
MQGAKVVASLDESFFKITQKANNLIQLRFSFRTPDRNDPINFFISAKVLGFNPYNNEKPELNFITVKYTQKPPNHLIATLGKLLDANINAKKRKEDRIVITPSSTRKLGLKNKESIIFIEKIPRRCLIRDLSFSGAKVIVSGIGKFLIKKTAILKIELEDQLDTIKIPGVIVRCEELEGRKDISILAINYSEKNVPIEYKMRINQYFKHTFT